MNDVFVISGTKINDQGGDFLVPKFWSFNPNSGLLSDVRDNEVQTKDKSCCISLDAMSNMKIFGCTFIHIKTHQNVGWTRLQVNKMIEKR